MKSRLIVAAIFCTAAILAIPGLKAQDTAPAPPPPPMFANRFFISFAGPGMNGKTVTGAPYSAVETTDTIQTLSDGNHIDRKSSASLYRDSQGRTRSERKLSMIGPWRASGSAPTLITINDPVAQTRYLLDANNKTAHKMPWRAHHLQQMMGQVQHEGGRPYQRMVGSGPEGEPQTESLGTEMINGVEAQGTRITRTIPAGKIGNEKPITITSERWYSPDLQVYVLVKQDDPRMGQTTVQLTNISRAEPDPSLFQVPADYTVKDGPPRHDVLFPVPQPPSPPPPPDQSN